MRDYVESVLKERRGCAIGIEFGGVGTRLFSGFSPNFFTQTVGVTLIDHRTERERQCAQADGAPRHEVIEGNMLASQTYVELDQVLNGQKADFIIERLGRGIEFIPSEPYTLMRTLDAWYER